MAVETQHFDVAIIGAGPAGLTSAIYTSRAGLSTVIIDESSAGGQVKSTHQVANYPGFIEPIPGYQLAQNMKDQASKYGAKFRLVSDVTDLSLLDQEKSIEIDGNEKITADYIILATGRSPRKLNLPGENELRGQGLSYCATCDGEFYRDKEIFVIGGGNSAIEESFLLLKYVKKLTIIHQFDVLQAEKISAEKILAHPKVEIYWSHEPRSFSKDGEKIVVELENLKTKERLSLSRDGVFIFVGMIPNSNLIQQKGLTLTKNGYIPTNDLMETNVENIYAVGDIRDKKTWQITVAVGEGTIAALEIVKKSV
jgi:thioredoxin reductase (NADPH)